MDERARGGATAPPEAGAVARELPSRNLPPATYQDLPDPLPLRKVLGPGVVSIGIGVSSGELIIWPFITSQIGLVFLWAAVIGVLVLEATRDLLPSLSHLWVDAGYRGRGKEWVERES